MSTREFWISQFNHVSVITIILEERYSKHVLVLIRSSSILSQSHLTLHSFIEDEEACYLSVVDVEALHRADVFSRTTLAVRSRGFVNPQVEGWTIGLRVAHLRCR